MRASGCNKNRLIRLYRCAILPLIVENELGKLLRIRGLISKKDLLPAVHKYTVRNFLGYVEPLPKLLLREIEVLRSTVEWPRILAVASRSYLKTVD